MTTRYHGLLIELENPSPEALKIAQNNLLMFKLTMDIAIVSDDATEYDINRKLVELHALRSLIKDIAECSK